MNVPATMQSDTWTVAGRTYSSRLIVGTGKYKSLEENAAAVEASGAEIVTVAVRRVNISDPNQPMLTDFIDPKEVTYLPNTAGCFTAEDAIRAEYSRIRSPAISRTALRARPFVRAQSAPPIRLRLGCSPPT